MQLPRCRAIRAQIPSASVLESRQEKCDCNVRLINKTRITILIINLGPAVHYAVCRSAARSQVALLDRSLPFKGASGRAFKASEVALSERPSNGALLESGGGDGERGNQLPKVYTPLASRAAWRKVEEVHI